MAVSRPEFCENLRRDWASLGAVAVEKGIGGGDSPDDERQLPGEVEGILHARIHALSARRAVNVGRIAGEENATAR